MDGVHVRLRGDDRAHEERFPGQVHDAAEAACGKRLVGRNTPVPLTS